MSRFDISLAFLEPPEWPDTAAPLSVTYDAQPYTGRTGRKPQPVLAQRLVLHPDIDLSAYRAKAAIDWIEIRLVTPGLHQAINIQRAVSKCLGMQGGAYSVYVFGPNRETGYTGNQFVLRFQDPEPTDFKPLLEQTVGRYECGVDSVDLLEVAGVEISVDFYVRGSSRLSEREQNRLRWQMVDLTRRHLRPHPALTEKEGCRPRSFGRAHGGSGVTFVVQDRLGRAPVNLAQLMRLGVDESYWPALERSTYHQPPVDRTFWIGARGFHVVLKSMDKTTDKRDPKTGDAEQLVPAKRRARLEVTLQGDADETGGHGAVGLATVGDLYGFKFEAIRQAFFEFYLPTIGNVCDTERLPFSVKVTERSVFGCCGVYALDRLHRSIEAVNRAQQVSGKSRTRPTKLGKKGRLLSYVDLNRRFDTALKGLTHAWRS
ncbi:hypothetical protein [Sinisalibacter aestuarii]|uniref:Uncharacterized protein n=1 Tax=Sinisalibacter aestuarii TaxID=2949426 RepID=A0ABQ5LR50_9RHOB|nr:hypothetical protein [Sinisalibacter aestuarii]GKY87399.1 hypothetical protein STA1M1_12680 [Sinisalibacter aestuarii]